MKKLIATTATLVLLSAAPALAMSCCGGNGKASMCAKGGMKGSMAMNTKSKKGSCCCEGMAGGMSKRT